QNRTLSVPDHVGSQWHRSPVPGWDAPPATSDSTTVPATRGGDPARDLPDDQRPGSGALGRQPGPTSPPSYAADAARQYASPTMHPPYAIPVDDASSLPP